MAQKMLIDATHAEQTRVVVVDGNKVEEFDFETASRRQLAGNIYLAKVTRVEPSLQAAFVDYGGNRHGFLAFNEIHPDYYQIPAADRAALLREERELASDGDEEDDDTARNPKSRKQVSRSSSRRKPAAQAERSKSDDQVESRAIRGMDIVEPGDEAEDSLIAEGFGTSDNKAASDHEPSAAREEAPVAPALGDVASDEDAADDADNTAEEGADDAPAEQDDEGRSADSELDEPYRAADHATEIDDRIEAVSDGDPVEEERPRRKPRMRRYKIQEVIKVRQIMLVQVVKEERGNKGAALTTYLSLAGRYCVLMPNTARGGGISRKITNAADRQKLKAIANEIAVPEGAGLIIRTAGANRTKAEIKRDYEYLLRLWEQIRDLTLKSIAPTPIYEEGDLIKRSIRDLYNKNIDEVMVEGEAGYRAAKDFMKMIMPSHAKNVKPYQDSLPLFARYQVESYLAGMFNPTVQLPSGGYIVIGITEALVAIDINSGRATREGSIEETALKTNLEAAAEIARQLRLRDLAGLIVIDFIDMEERKNNAAVEKMLKDKLKDDRARIQVGRISGFGLLEMSRQRLRPGMLEATTQPCPHCHGTGLIRSDDSMGLTVLRQIEEEGTRGRSREVLVRAPAAVVNFIINHKREHLAQIEARYGMAVRLEADPQMISPDFEIEKFKTATRVAVTPSEVVSISTTMMPEIEEEEEVLLDEEDEKDTAEASAEGNGQGRKKRRRRRRKRGGAQTGAEDAKAETSEEADASGVEESVDAQPEEAATVTEPAEKPVANRRARKPAQRKRAASAAKAAEASEDTQGPESESSAKEEAGPAPQEDEAAPKPKPKRTRRKPAARKADTEAGTDTPEEAGADQQSASSSAAAEAAPDGALAERDADAKSVQADEDTSATVAAEAVEASPEVVSDPPAEKTEDEPAESVIADAEDNNADGPAPNAETTAEAPAPHSEAEPSKPKTRRRVGWWSLRQ